MPAVSCPSIPAVAAPVEMLRPPRNPANRAIVFLGPSLPLAEAQALLAADYRPPLCRGDLDAITEPAVVAVVDGVLDAEARLRPEEARCAAKRGIRLYGAASVGALLAVDPSISGSVIGIGRVVQLLRCGRVRADDLALLYAAHDLRPLTIPIVEVLCWLEDARVSGCVPPGDAEAARAALRELPLGDRSPSAIVRVLRHHLGPISPAIGDPLRLGVKATDARRLLQVVGKFLGRIEREAPAGSAKELGGSS